MDGTSDTFRTIESTPVLVGVVLCVLAVVFLWIAGGRR
jgi:hypothetical protein